MSMDLIVSNLQNNEYVSFNLGQVKFVGSEIKRHAVSTNQMEFNGIYSAINAIELFYAVTDQAGFPRNWAWQFYMSDDINADENVPLYHIVSGVRSGEFRESYLDKELAIHNANTIKESEDTGEVLPDNWTHRKLFVAMCEQMKLTTEWAESYYNSLA
jgi:hypothetical protein